MDPLTALGLAANAIQFVEFTSQLLSTAQEIHHAGASNAVLDLELISNDMSRLDTNLKEALDGQSESDALQEDDQVTHL